MIGVIGSGDPEKRHDPLAMKVGSLIAGRGAVMVCGGLSGIMEAASRGVSEAGGIAIGILPGSQRRDANPYVNYAIPTGMGVARNVLVVRASDALIALPGGAGTMSEIALAINVGRPVVDLGDWGIEGTVKAGTAEEAVDMALERASGGEGLERADLQAG
ncbi:MAG: TIGR00725 family protein [bacterium]|nr:MAG: TIGR00725 family protein [bacterium]